MHRFFTDKVNGDTAIIADPEQLHHLKDVLRLKTGDEIAVSDNTDKEYTGIITAISKKQAEVKVALVKAARENKVKLTIACAIPKGSRFDDVLDYLTQLGVERIMPMRTERVVVKLDGAKAEEKHRRWQKIVQSAAKQSQRSRMPEVDALTGYGEVIEKSQSYGLKLIPHLSGDRKPLRDILAASRPKSIIILIGPEGDFTPGEVKLALDNGFIPVSLGGTVLRVATAAIAAAVCIKFATGD